MNCHRCCRLLQAYFVFCLVSCAQCQQFDTSCLDSQQGVYVAVGDELQLNCNVSSSAEYKCSVWPLNLSDIVVRRLSTGVALSGRVELIEDVARFTLDRTARLSDNGNVYCSLGDVTGNTTVASPPTHVYVLRRPIKPHLVRCVLDNWQRLTCWWKPSTEQQHKHARQHNKLSNQLTWTTAHSNWTSWQVCTPTTTSDNSSTCSVTADVDVLSPYCFRANVTSEFLNISVLSDVVCWRLRDIVRPAAPAQLTHSILNSTRVTLLWKRRYSHADDFNVPLIYRIYVTPAQRHTGTKEYETSSESVVIGVVPYTQYKVTIIAKPVSAGYLSQPSATYEFVTPPSVPCRQPTLAPDVYYPDRDTIRLYWKELPERDRCGPNFHYTVVARADSAGTIVAGSASDDVRQSWTNVAVVNSTSLDVSLSRLSSLTGGQSLQLSVMAENREGPASGPLQSVTVISSLMRSVARLAAEGDDGTVRMRWTPPSDVTASDVTSLTVYWCLAASSKRGACANDVSWLDVSVADKLVATPVEVEMKLNDTFEHYQVGVAARVLDNTSTDVVSRRRPINWADCIYTRNASLSAPSDVGARAVNTTELDRVLVTWTTPDCTSGLVDTFVVEYCIVDSHSNCTGDRRRVAVPAVVEVNARQSYEVTGLDADTEYGFRLYSATDARRSQSSAFVVARTAHRGPPITVITGVIVAAISLVLLLLAAASIFKRLRKCLIPFPPFVFPRHVEQESAMNRDEQHDLQQYDDSEIQPLKCAAPKMTGSTRSNDSGLGPEEALNTPPSVDTPVKLLDDATTTGSARSSNVFQPPPTPSDDYVRLDVVAWKNDEDKSLMPLRPSDAHLLAHIDVQAQSTSQQALAVPGVDTSCHGDTTLQNVTDGILSTSCSEDEHGSLPVVSVASSMAACPHNTDQQANAMPPADRVIPPYIMVNKDVYIPLEQLQQRSS